MFTLGNLHQIETALDREKESPLDSFLLVLAMSLEGQNRQLLAKIHPMEIFRRFQRFCLPICLEASYQTFGDPQRLPIPHVHFQGHHPTFYLLFTGGCDSGHELLLWFFELVKWYFTGKKRDYRLPFTTLRLGFWG